MEFRTSVEAECNFIRVVAPKKVNNSEEVKKARMLNKIMKSKSVPSNVKLLKTVLKPTVIYESEAWVLNM